ncbi:MAG: T9SS type A sorting domain-containing protein [Saprospiraceae bacterium]|nr:T9SS type A sorting domain-containing protein [Saprospiraceae bacterium]MCF8251633.1 T9SS type A sorting domain-containing protein [Saprospiraceae bacterium]MCF8281354.1 T9SS type A sorting domain-containing protein [Bacteroidales bacterium]MCF8312277.1 T9SS type A sorting domain-containing protein [Saprospiraceae bacterium]MCF8441985.1 T9SS type A sorting domain-containing protein [Saprospiraceae bacterium]
MKAKIFYLLFSINLFANIGTAQPGALDIGFGENGIVHRSFEYPSSKTYSGQAILETPDGKILTAGISGGDNGLVARFNTDGSTDTLSPALFWFSHEGGVLIFGGASYAGEIPIEDAFFYDIALQPDGKMVSVGYVNTNEPAQRYILLRQNADGDYDPTFGEHGHGFSLGSNYGGSGRSVAIQPDGKILVGDNNTVVGYLSNGHIDTAFATNGKFFPGFGVSANVILLPDGKIVVAGFTMGAFALARANSNGTLDNGFGTNGVALADIASSIANIKSLELLLNGDIIAIGQSGGKLAVAKFKSNGQLDMDYGMDGVAHVELTGKLLVGTSSTLQSDGKLLVAGYVGTSGQNVDDLLLARFITEGVLDDSFGDGGLVITDQSPKSDRLNDVAMQEDGKIIVTGYAGKDYGANGWGTEFIVARYLSGLEVDAKEEATITQKLTVGPNPTSDFLNIKLLGQASSPEATLRIINLDGRLQKIIVRPVTQSSFTLPVSDWAAGMYFLQYMEGSEVMAVEKFVVLKK